MHKKAAAAKSPKVLSEALAWLGISILEFGLQCFNVKSLVEWVRADLTNTNAVIRQVQGGRLRDIYPCPPRPMEIPG